MTHGIIRRVSRVLLLTVSLWALGCGGSNGGSPVAESDGDAEWTAEIDGIETEELEIPLWEDGECAVSEGGEAETEYLTTLGCMSDFRGLASDPLSTTLPGARSAKVVLDTADGNALYFQNSVLYAIHYDFVSSHLSGNGLPLVPDLTQFNATEYYSPERRFILGAVTFYEGPGLWALELAPYDRADETMIETLFEAVKGAAFFGPALFFHPTSESVTKTSEKLPDSVPIATTDQIYSAIDYQPLSLGAGIGRLRFLTAENLETAELSYTDLLVLDQAPNDISVVQGLITQEFQTPLSHVNILSQNRHTPNMGLRGAMSHPDLLALDGKLVKLTVGASDWSIETVEAEEAQAFWEANKPDPVTLPEMDLEVRDLLDAEEVTPDPGEDQTLREAIKNAARSFGGKTAHYSLLVRTPDVPIKKAFGVPVYYYDQFMRSNGFYDQVEGFLQDSSFNTDPSVRARKLAQLRTEMMSAPLDEAFMSRLKAKVADGYGGHTLRFRTSTNSEDLDGFPCAGCYESHTGDPAVWTDVENAIRETYASAWLFRTFEERSYYGVAHESVGMALLVHTNFPEEEANGVAVTANPYDASGLDPAFYVNVQAGGDVEVVAPPAGVTSDQFLYYFSEPNQPVTYLSHSSLLMEGESVLTVVQIHALGVALSAIHERFSEAYGPASGNQGWYAMDVEFKFDDEENPGEAPVLYIKQARPYPGRGE